MNTETTEWKMVRPTLEMISAGINAQVAASSDDEFDATIAAQKEGEIMDECRKQFEAWYGKEYSNYTLTLKEGDKYTNFDTELAWQSWKKAVAAGEIIYGGNNGNKRRKN